MTTDDTLTDAEFAALAAHGWMPEGEWRTDRLLLLRFRRGPDTRVMTVEEWRAEMTRLEEPMDDDSGMAQRLIRQERINLLSGMVQELRRSVARLTAERDEAQKELALLREVYNDLLRVVQEREMGR